MATRRKPPKVEPRDSCFAGVTISAIFRPGEKIDSSGVGSVGSSWTARANARKPNSDPMIAGKIRRNSKRLSIGLKSNKPLGGRFSNFGGVTGYASRAFRGRGADGQRRAGPAPTEWGRNAWRRDLFVMRCLRAPHQHRTDSRTKANTPRDAGCSGHGAIVVFPASPGWSPR